MRSLRASIAMVLLFALPSAAHAQLTIVNNLAGAFEDITGDPDTVEFNPGDNDEIVFVTTVGNAVLPAGRIVIGNNGGIGFDPLPSDELEPLNEPIPANGAYEMGRALLPYWDNIGNGIGAGRILVLERVGDELIIQWNLKPIGDADSTVTFQVKIFDGATALFSQYIYADILQPGADGGGSATIGFQGGPPGPNINDVEWSFNQQLAVDNQTVLSLILEEHPAAIPTVSQWGLIALGALLAGAALVLLRRRAAIAV